MTQHPASRPVDVEDHDDRPAAEAVRRFEIRAEVEALLRLDLAADSHRFPGRPGPARADASG